LTGGAALLFGGLFGFLFGIPRSLQREGKGKEENAKDGAGKTIEAAASQFGDNTNLEQISDWLTKIIVGVGLTQLYHIPQKVRDLVDYVATGWTCVGACNSHAFILALLIHFTSSGLIFGYLLTRIFLPGAFSRAARSQVELLEAEVKDMRSAVSEGVGRMPAAEARPLGVRADPGMAPVGDPQKGLWGGINIASGRELIARVEELPYHNDWFVVTLTVRSVKDAPPLTGTVTFHLHPTFAAPDREVAVIDGKATLELRAWGAFTVGAEADNGQTKLELDLAALKNAPRVFRNR
jgi:hypothetical protein